MTIQPGTPVTYKGEYVCTVPPDLGRVTSFKVIFDTLVAETGSGIPFIVPVPKELADG